MLLVAVKAYFKKNQELGICPQNSRQIRILSVNYQVFVFGKLTWLSVVNLVYFCINQYKKVVVFLLLLNVSNFLAFKK